MKPKHNHMVDECDKTLEQFESCANEEFVTAAALMPDAHAGYVAPIGSVLVTKDYIVPSWVGFDIGCGMTAAKLDNVTIEEIRNHISQIYEQVKSDVPMDMGVLNKTENVSDESRTELKELVKKFKEGPHQKQTLNFIQSASLNHVGSLGGGNHFIELCEATEDENAWIVIHSGSRGIGYKLAQKYMKLAAGDVEQFEQTFPLKTDSELGQEYLNVLDFGLSFALLNRKEMIKQTVNCIQKVLQKNINWDIWTNKNHNHAIEEDGLYYHRKGATPAKKGERGVIPGNMRDGSFLVEGLGNADFLFSSSHGAGRKMGRAQARKEITLEQFQESMKNITGTISESVIDEAPQAYKDIFAVMDKQKDSVKIVNHLKPIINWKGEFKRG